MQKTLIISLFTLLSIPSLLLASPRFIDTSKIYKSIGKYNGGSSATSFFRRSGENSIYGVSRRSFQDDEIYGVKDSSIRELMSNWGSLSNDRLNFRRRDLIGTGRKINGFRPVRR